MTIWNRISAFFTGTAATAISAVIEQVRTVFEGDPQTRARVAFSVAMIALSAKMAKADGVVSESEVDAFREIFQIPDSEASNVAALYNLAKKDVAGFQAYARQLAELCGSGKPDCPVLRDIIDGLFHIAKADGLIHENEMAFLGDVAEIFGLSDAEFERIIARHVDRGRDDPWRILGLSPGTSHEAARARYRELVREYHPDAMIARGVPEEFAGIAHERMAAITGAWAAIEPELARTRVAVDD